MAVTNYVLTVFISVLFCTLTTAWNIPNELFLWRFAIWRNRAFLTAPRWHLGTSQPQNELQPTLLQAPWPEGLTTTSYAHVYPFSNKSIYNECLRSATDLEIDGKARLWVLEVPDRAICSARIIIYDLRRNNQVVTAIRLTNVPTENLRSLAVDPTGSTAYIGDPGDESIVIFTLESRMWWTIRLSHGPRIPRVYTSDLAVSWKTPTLYLTGANTLDLFSINLDEWRSQEELSILFGYEPRSISVFWHGTKMGYSTGLFCDTKGGLHYFMCSQRASVRWDTRLPLRAENHEVLWQNESCPSINDYAFDPQKNVWALVNEEPESSKRAHSKRSTLKLRTVKILKS